MPSEPKLPAVTKNGNYPQPVKHLKPLVLAADADVVVEDAGAA